MFMSRFRSLGGRGCTKIDMHREGGVTVMLPFTKMADLDPFVSIFSQQKQSPFHPGWEKIKIKKVEICQLVFVCLLFNKKMTQEVSL